MPKTKDDEQPDAETRQFMADLEPSLQEALACKGWETERPPSAACRGSGSLGG